MIVELPNWRKDCEKAGIDLAESIIQMFESKLMKAVGRLPKADAEQSTFLLNNMVDALLGSTVQIVIQKARSFAPDLEERLVEGVRGKFRGARAMSLQETPPEGA